MKKCVNGIVTNMTDADIKRRESRSSNRKNPHSDKTTEYEVKIKKLEDSLAEVLAKLSEKTEEVESTEVKS